MKGTRKDMPGVYIIINKVTKESYVGSTIRDLQGRIQRHYDDLRKNKHGNKFMQNSFNKYREKSFVSLILEEIDDVEIIRSREQFYIDKLHPEFNSIVNVSENIKSSGKGFTEYNQSQKGKPISEKKKLQLERARQAYREQGVSQETRDKLSKTMSEREITWGDKISLSKQGKELSQEHKDAIGEGVRNHKYSEEARKKLGWRKGTHRTQDEIERIRAGNIKSHSGKTLSPEHKQAIGNGLRKAAQRRRETKQQEQNNSLE